MPDYTSEDVEVLSDLRCQVLHRWRCRSSAISLPGTGACTGGDSTPSVASVKRKRPRSQAIGVACVRMLGR